MIRQTIRRVRHSPCPAESPVRSARGPNSASAASCPPRPVRPRTVPGPPEPPVRQPHSVRLPTQSSLSQSGLLADQRPSCESALLEASGCFRTPVCPCGSGVWAVRRPSGLVSVWVRFGSADAFRPAQTTSAAVPGPVGLVPLWVWCPCRPDVLVGLVSPWARSPRGPDIPIGLVSP